ncbi:class II fructose-bisphosphatase [Candidatus Woesebacteria bacterium]|nr:class II fructose-bisphosphatase [Candidatus Woesebacteria bacterium]
MPERLFNHKERASQLEFIHTLGNQLSYATELGAIAAARTAGFGDKKKADFEAVEAMRGYLNTLNIKGTIVIGEGERDEAPMLYIGEEVGTGNGREVDIAVDPLENTNAAAVFGPRAISVLAVSEKGGLFHAPDMYMNKLVVGPRAKSKIDIDAPVEHNLARIAESLDREMSDLVVVVLDRERNTQIIEGIRKAGARVRLIPDGDLLPGVMACFEGSGIHALMGIGAAPEGVMTAAAVKALNGEMQARFWPTKDGEIARLKRMGGEANKVYSQDELASGSTIIFSATGVTDGDTLQGVRFFGGGVRTETLIVSMIGNELVHVGRKDWIHGYEREKIEFRL